MLARCLSAASAIVLCSLAVWPGCGGSEAATPRLRDSDSGTKSDASANVDEDEDAGTVDSGTGTPVDAGSDATSTLPPPATIVYGTCPAFTPCGGEATGTWTVTGGCLSDATFAAVKQAPCDGVQESDVVLKAAGTLTANGGKITRNTKVEMTAKLAVPKACAEQAPGGSCAIFQYGLTTEIQPGTPPFFDTATCTSNGAGGCNCNVSKTTAENTVNDYTASGNVLTTTDPTRTFDYCVQGTKISYKETTEGSLPIVVELTK